MNEAFGKRARSQQKARFTAAQRLPRRRMPSVSGYLLASGATAAALFFILWWMLNSSGDEAPWVPAGLAASVVMLVAVAAREVVMRRAWARYILESDRRDTAHSAEAKKQSGSGSRLRSVESYSSLLRSLQRQSKEANAPGALPEAHLDTYISCQDYIEGTDAALRSSSVGSESRIALRAGQERARALARQHLLNWARGLSRSLTNEAQQRVRLSEKIETANRALNVIDSALHLYPDESELRESDLAVREFIASTKVSHWIELAERAAFKGYHARAIDRYRDALFYLSRENFSEAARAEMADRITREIDMLRVRLKMRKIEVDPPPHPFDKRSQVK